MGGMNDPPTKKDPPILGLWPLFLVANLVMVGLIVWQWKNGTFWIGFHSGCSKLIGLIVWNLILLYGIVRDRMKQR
jgi:hypothetical protein